MKYPNHEFAGMSMVKSTTISAMILDYYPNASQRGGARRLSLLKKATNLSELIDFCIDGYRAWGDAVLMGAGAYLKIGNYPDEVAEAKKYVKEEVSEYLKRKPFPSASDYDAWHKNICLNLSIKICSLIVEKKKYVYSFLVTASTYKSDAIFEGEHVIFDTVRCSIK